MAKIDGDALAAALGAAGIAVAVVGEDGSVSANGPAAALRDLPGLARSALDKPVSVTAAGAPWEVRAVKARGATVVVGRDTRRAEELQRTVAANDELLSFASHELKNPLHVLGMVCYLIETRVKRGQPVEQQSVQQLRRQVGRLARMINELLDYTRAREGRLQLVRESADLVELARSATEHAGEGRQGDLAFRAPPREIPVEADRQRLGEAIEHLIDNAARFTPKGSPIEVTVTDGPAPTVTVTDRGTGVPIDERASLFEPQVPQRDEPRRPERGLGLGLHLARIVARLHGGDLVYEPVEPSGASFSLRLA